MIEFPCRCGHIFYCEDAMAGAAEQCPNCGRLNTVPTLSEAQTLADDGTYLLDEPAERPQPSTERVKELSHVFRKQRTDAEGYEIDLRGQPGAMPAVDPLSSAAAIAAGNDYHRRPRYDPETGELVRHLDVRPDPERDAPKASIPLAKPALTYATGVTLHSTWSSRLLRLLAPANVTVMFFVLIIHLISLWSAALSIATGILLLAPGLFMLQFLVACHYGNVIEETGVEGNDELPRFLRDLRFSEDIWNPLKATVGGTLLCYLPAILCVLAAILPAKLLIPCMDVLATLAWFMFGLSLFLGLSGIPLHQIVFVEDILRPTMFLLIGTLITFVPAGLLAIGGARQTFDLAVAGILAALGSILLPGVLLTLTTSASVVNMRPDRLLKTIAECGSRYIIAVVLWLLSLPLYLAGQAILVIGAATLIGGNSVFASWSPAPWMKHSILAIPLLSAGIFIMHYFCFEVGTLYRDHHEAFPWLFQRHVREDETPQPRVRLVRAIPK